MLGTFLWLGIGTFGPGRPAYMYHLVSRKGWIPERALLGDLGLAQTLPGGTFIALTVLCGLRLGGPLLALVGLGLVVLPGAAAMIAAMLFLTDGDPRFAGFLHGIVVGAVGAFAAAFVRSSRGGIRSRADALLACAALLLTVAKVPLTVTIPLVVGAGLIWRRPGGGHEA